MTGRVCILTLLLCLPPLPARGVDSVSATGRIDLQGVAPIGHDGPGVDPSLTGRIEADARSSAWRLHGLVEGGWDGTVGDDGRDASLFKDFSHVYQDSSPFVEIKELYLEREAGAFGCRIGIQRYFWGRLDEYPVNDLLNPWDYNQVFVKSLEERKIGAPSIAVDMHRADRTYQLVWVPWFVPYRLPDPNGPWSAIQAGDLLSTAPDTRLTAVEPDLPSRTIGNSSFGFRMQQPSNQVDWAITLFHGIDPRPVFKTTTLSITRTGDQLLIDPGFVPSFHTITSIGADGAAVLGDWSLRAEGAYTMGRAFNVRQELWGYPETLEPGSYTLNPVEVKRNTLDYGIGADYELKEDWLLTLQAQQTEIFGRPDSLYEKERETLLWVNLKISRLIQRLEINLNIAYNPEHGASMVRPSLSYTLTDNWKITVAGLFLDGPPQSIFGKYTADDQVATTLTYAWETDR